MRIQELMSKVPDEIKGGQYDVVDLRPIKEAILELAGIASTPPPATEPTPEAVTEPTPEAVTEPTGDSPPEETVSPTSKRRR